VFRLIQYIRYLLHAKGPHGVHSPFVYRIIENVLDDDRQYYAFDAIKHLRRDLLASKERITVTDLGAGSKHFTSPERMVADIAKTAVKAPKYAQMLFRLAQLEGYTSVLELGTSLGITSAYLAAATKSVVTLEGCPQHVRLAKQHAEKLGLTGRMTFLQGNFDDLLIHPAVQAEFDLIFIDGNHRGDALKRYVTNLRPQLRDGGCFVIDDIHWSPDMQQAWDEISQHEDYQLSIDLFELGLLFTGRDMVKQHFTLWY
jgi:predicted O-methyltransferase YrrM